MAGPERVVVLVNDLTIRGSLRLQKYGFVAARLYGDDLSGLGFYRDWMTYDCGPYSRDLAEDVQFCVGANILGEERQTTQDGHAIRVYSLKPEGRRILRALAAENGSVIKELHGKLARLDNKSLRAMLKDAYESHPEHAANGLIRNSLPEGDATDADDYEEFVPEIEKTLESIDSGAYVAKRYTPGEYRKYIKRVLEE